MAEIRVNSTGGVKLYDADDSHYAQIKAGTVTSNTDVLELGSGAVVAGTKVDLNGQELILDADADTSITADTDDQIDVRIAGADDFQFTANTFTAQSGSSIVVPDGGLTFGSTAITSTAAELNILDGVTSTAAELNIVDGNTSATSTTIADADRVVLNDNGTMVQAAVTDLKTYIGGGKVLQVVGMTTANDHTTTSTTYSDTNITLAITPSATNSKVLILIQDSVQITMAGGNNDNGMSFRLTKTIGGTTTTVVTDNQPYEGFYHSIHTGTNPNYRQHMHFSTLDSPNTTSAVTYTHQINVYRGSNSGFAASVHDNNRGSMILMEIGA